MIKIKLYTKLRHRFSKIHGPIDLIVKDDDGDYLVITKASPDTALVLTEAGICLGTASPMYAERFIERQGV